MSKGYQTQILEACQDHGLVLGKSLKEIAGWKTRGSSAFDPKVSVNHHTAGPRNGELPSLATLIYGRSDLPGPLCNAGHGRSTRENPGGSIYLIAAGKANHAGPGSWKGWTGNARAWGLEVEHIGYPTEPVSDERWDVIYRWHAACIDVSGTDASHVAQHFEWAGPRKIDFQKLLLPGGVGGFRKGVDSILNLEKGFLMSLSDKDQADLKKKVDELHKAFFGAKQPADRHPSSNLYARIDKAYSWLAQIAKRDGLK